MPVYKGSSSAPYKHYTVFERLREMHHASDGRTVQSSLVQKVAREIN